MTRRWGGWARARLRRVGDGSFAGRGLLVGRIRFCGQRLRLVVSYGMFVSGEGG